MVKNQKLIIFLIFMITLAARLSFTLTSNTFDSESYFVMRQVEHIRATGLPLYNDPLSYGGREYQFLPFFHYLLAGISFILPLDFVYRVIPQLFASSLVIFVYLFVKEFTKDILAALFSSFISGFIPVFFASTLGLSPLSFIMPMIVLLLYLLLKADSPAHTYLFIAGSVILALTHYYAALLVTGFFVYIALRKVDDLDIKKEELELILFSAFFTFFVLLTISKRAFLMHGIAFIWQNIPKQILNNYFADFSIINAVYQVGPILFLATVYIIYRESFITKRKPTTLLISFALTTMAILYVKLIPITVGLSFLSVVLVLLFGEFFILFLEFVEKTKVSQYKNLLIIALIILFIGTSVLPSIVLANASLEMSPSSQFLQAMEYLKRISPADAVVMASPEDGHIITKVANRSVVMDTNFIQVRSIDQRYNDIRSVYRINSDINTIRILQTYNVTFLIITDRAKEEFNIERVPFAQNRNCFREVWRNPPVYKVECHLE